MVRRHARHLLSVLAAVSLSGAPVVAQQVTATADASTPLAVQAAPSGVRWPAMATPVYAARHATTGIRQKDLWKFGSMLAAAGVVATADRRGDAWARRSAVQHNDALRVLSDIGDVSGSYGAIGVGPATWLLGRVRGDSGTAVMGLRTTEAVMLSGVTIGVIKALAGRTRPYASADNSPTHWDFLGGLRSDSTRSFASGHSALSAAAAVTLAAEWRRQGRSGWKTVGPPLVYALAGVTAGSRVRDRQHWLSDVVTGSAVGMLSAVVVRRWHDTHPGSRLDRTFLRH